ncbi:hypothetical protein C0J52_17522 [Blattella germanica]|nr:hypothetical protein C0J52_17522 [Blattella germanica]
MKGDGIYANYSNNCQTYYSYTCGPGYSFSLVAQSCIPSNKVICVESHCAATGTGSYIIPGTGCQAYYQCYQGTRTDYVCPEDTIYDRHKKACIQNGGMCYEPLCTGRVNGHYSDTSHNCERSFECSGGVLKAVYGCPNGKLHNGHACLPADNVMCQSPDSTAVVIRPSSYNPCTTLSDGPHPLRDKNGDCRTYILCKDRKKFATLLCPIGQHFNGRHCTDNSKNPCASDCAHRPDGFYADLLSGCRNYFYCVEGQMTDQKTCTEGTVFDGNMCIPSQLFKCPIKNDYENNKCNSKEDGFHTDYASTCKHYYFCSEGKMLLQGACSEGQIWNGKTCVEQSTFICKSPEPWPGCIDMAEGLYQDYSSYCHYYYYCENGNRTLLSCPKDEIFDGKTCIPASSYKCPTIETDVCNKRVDGYYRDLDSNCRSYYYCSNGHKITYVCPGSFIFDGKECVDPSNYKCPFTSTDCLSQSNGYHYDKGSGCRNYFYCLDGDKITTLTCADNKIFDGQRCVESSDFNCPDYISDNFCSYQPDGLFPQAASRCQRYIHCKEKKLMSVLTCPDGKMFNGSICVEATSSDDSCISLSHKSSSPSPDCATMINGFYQNYTSNCNSYFYCINGMKTTLFCPGDEVFNGQLCVNRKFYTCPSSQTEPANPCLQNNARDESKSEKKELIVHIFPPT